MIALLQRVAAARVEIAGDTVGAIDAGLLVFIGVERGDGEAEAGRLLERVLTYRVFPDGEGRMNRSVRDLKGGLLLVPQFTLAADTSKGTRPSFTPAATPEEGERWFTQLVDMAVERHHAVASGRFGAAMRVHLINDGPVTFWLRAAPRG